MRPNQRWKSASQRQVNGEARGVDAITQRNSEGRDIKAKFAGAYIFKGKEPSSQLVLHLSPIQPGPQSPLFNSALNYSSPLSVHLS